jgi:hypothetical protein
MADTIITIPVDAETARAYESASPELQHKIQLLVRLRVRDLLVEPQRPLREIMDEIGREAEAQGMTPEILAELLRDE